MKILFASHTFMGGPFVVGSHHLARRFVAQGDQVVHLSPPVTPFHGVRGLRDPLFRERLRSAGRTMLKTQKSPELTPLALVPWQARGQLSRLLGRPISPFLHTVPPLAIQLRAADMLEPDLLLIDEPRYAGIERLVRPRRLVYRVTDNYAQMRNDPTISEVEQHCAEAADGIIVTSRVLKDHIEALMGNRGKPCLIVENGVDLAHFFDPQAAPEVVAKLPRPRLVYAGAFDDRLNLQLLERLASEVEASLVLIGPWRGKRPAFFARGNVQFLDQIAFERLPAYLQACDIGLLPLSDHPANISRSPMKLYEYAACGLRVVASRTSELGSRPESFITLANTDAHFVTLVREVCATLPSPADPRPIPAGVSNRDWAVIARTIKAFIKEL